MCLYKHFNNEIFYRFWCRIYRLYFIFLSYHVKLSSIGPILKKLVEKKNDGQIYQAGTPKLKKLGEIEKLIG